MGLSHFISKSLFNFYEDIRYSRKKLRYTIIYVCFFHEKPHKKTTTENFLKNSEFIPEQRFSIEPIFLADQHELISIQEIHQTEGRMFHFDHALFQSPSFK